MRDVPLRIYPRECDFRVIHKEQRKRYIMENLTAADVAAVTRPNYMG